MTLSHFPRALTRLGREVKFVIHDLERSEIKFPFFFDKNPTFQELQV